MLHGKSTLQFMDAVTGKEQERIESENFITNFYRDLIGDWRKMLQFGVQSINWAAFRTEMNPYRFTRGVYLIDRHLPNDAACTFFTGDEVVTGRAGGPYTGTDPARGNRNDSLSVAIPGGYRMVWDFDTPKANGTIAALALVSETTGAAGPTSVWDDVVGTVYNGDRGQFSSIDASGMASLNALAGCIKNGGDPQLLYYNTSGSTAAWTLDLRRVKSKNTIGVNINDHFISAELLGQIAMSANHYISLSYHRGVLYGIQVDRGSTPNRVWLKTFDLSLNELTSVEVDIINNIPVSADRMIGIGHYENFVYAGIAYLKQNNNGNIYHRYRISDGQYQGTFSFSNASGSSKVVTNYNDNLLAVFDSGYGWIDRRRFRLMKPGGQSYFYSSTASNTGITPRVEMFESSGYNITDQALNHDISRFFTINNLAQTRTKTNQQILRVTYEITES